MRGAEASLLALQSRVLPLASHSCSDLPPTFEGPAHTPADAERSSHSVAHFVTESDDDCSKFSVAASAVVDISSSVATWGITNTSSSGNDNRFSLFPNHNATAGQPALTTLTYSHHPHPHHHHHHHQQHQQQHFLTPSASNNGPMAHPTTSCTPAMSHPTSPASSPTTTSTLTPSSLTFLPQTAYLPGLEDLNMDFYPFDPASQFPFVPTPHQTALSLPHPAYPPDDCATLGSLQFGVPGAATFQTFNGGSSSNSSSSGREEGGRSGRSSCNSSPNSALEMMDKERSRQLKAALRKERNKEAARRSNLNKKIVRHQLELRSTELWEENLQLHQDIRDLSNKLRQFRHVCSTMKHVCRPLVPSALVPMTSCR